MAPAQAIGHAKWPALFKKHIGVLESHVRLMDRLQMSMRSELKDLPDEEREKILAGEKGNWKVMEGMMERSKEVLQQARGVATGVLPQKQIQKKKSARQKEREEKARVLGAGGSQTNDTPKEASESEAVNHVEAGADFVPLTLLGKKRRRDSAENDRKDKVEGDTNPYFMVDTEPTPVAVLSGEKKSKKLKKDKTNRRASDLLREPELIGKKDEADEAEAAEAEPASPNPQAASLGTEGEKKKKRRRSERSEVSEVEQEIKRSKKEKKEKQKKRKADESESVDITDEGDGKSKRRKHKHKDGE